MKRSEKLEQVQEFCRYVEWLINELEERYNETTDCDMQYFYFKSKRSLEEYYNKYFEELYTELIEKESKVCLKK